MDTFGMVKKSVMQDKNLTVQEKGLYAYLVSYTSVGITVFPNKKTILNDLGIGDKTYKKYLKNLIANGNISIEPVIENGKLIYNLVTIDGMKLKKLTRG